jgi:hypothetical protein
MSDPEETSTQDLKTEQRERKQDEREAERAATTPDESDQHRRRADKAAYLEEKLVERERAERDAD